MNPPHEGDIFELIELAATCRQAQNREFQATLAYALEARAYPGVVYSYRRINARVVEVFVHDTSGVKDSP